MPLRHRCGNSEANKMFSRISAFFISVLIALTSAFSFIPRQIWFGSEKYEAADSESMILNAALISDTHSDSSFFHDRSKIMRRVFCGVSQTDDIPDVLVMAGDISNASDPKEYRMLEWSMENFNKIGTVLPAAGNHDVRARDTYAEACGYFCDFARFCGIETDKTYYSADVNGFKFIILGSEDKLSLEADISDAQLQWLEAQLIEGMKTNKPVFIVCHQPLYDSNNVRFDPDAEKNYGVGSQSGRIEEILEKYVPDYGYPVFFINGHLHHDFNDYTVDGDFCKNLYCITLPSASKTGEGGLGMALEVYPDKILLRGRNYITAEWINEYSIPLNTPIS